jgi:hypothetical protein
VPLERRKLQGAPLFHPEREYPMIDFGTIQLSHMLSIDDLIGLNHFLSHTAFVISHKSEPIEKLAGVLWYLPPDSPVLVVSNCEDTVLGEMRNNLVQQLPRHSKLYLIHQKDRAIARFFAERGVPQILGDDHRVVSGKGEGMYIGALAASLLGYPEWVVFFDADNLAPSALVEYTFAMYHLFYRAAERPALHNVRVFWASKPGKEDDPSEQVVNDLRSGWI